MQHPLDLVLTLEYLVHALARARRWRRSAVMLTVGLPEPHVVFHDGLRLYLGPAVRPFVLRGVSARELMATYREITPVLDPAATLYRFDLDGSGSIEDRTEKLAASDEARVRQVLHDAADHVARWRARVTERERTLGDVPAWQRCPVCSPLPDAFPFWRGTTPDGQPQIAEWYLGIVDGPDSADMSDRGECTKRCPWCSTRYRWRSDYEYLVNGASETETSLTRLA